MTKSKDENELTSVPGVGPSIAQDLNRLGINTVNDLKHKDAHELYDKLAILDGHPHDRCVLYVFACAVYYANTTNPNPELLKWWRWKQRV